MSRFAYRDGVLHAEDVSLAALAAEAGTPIYVYAAGVMHDAYRDLAGAFTDRAPLICFAVKANSTLAVIRLFGALGAGADTVSAGEIERALAAGVPPSRIVYAGVGKTDAELAFALQQGVLQINVEAVEELARLDAIARAVGTRAAVALRVNPDVAAGGHDKISTGRKGDKFGIPIAAAGAAFEYAASLPGIDPVGVHVHIGSQIAELAAFEAAYRHAAGLFRAMRERGLQLRRLDLGGGLGVRYGDEAAVEAGRFAAMVRRVTDGLDAELILEPGRWLTAAAGVLLARVIQRKDEADRRFLILDAGMNNLVRPAMYGAFHGVQPVRQPVDGARTMAFDVVGPICESSDVLGRDRPLPELVAGDLVAIADAGAYGAVMASSYNSRPSAAEVLVDVGRWAIVKPRRDARAQFADEAIPDWLGEP